MEEKIIQPINPEEDLTQGLDRGKTLQDLCDKVNKYWEDHVLPIVEKTSQELKKVLQFILDKVDEKGKFSDEDLRFVNSKIDELGQSMVQAFFNLPKDDFDEADSFMAYELRAHRVQNKLLESFQDINVVIKQYNNTGVWNGPLSVDMDLPLLMEELKLRIDDFENFYPKDLGEMLDSVVFVMSKLLERGNIKTSLIIKTIREGEAQPIYVEEMKGILQESLRELVQNAIYHMAEGGKLDLSVEEIGDKVSVIVADTGRGISPENIDHIFDKGFTTRKTGTGRGLFFVKWSIEKILGGKIEVESEEGKGTKFLITLPKYKSPE